MARRAGCSRLDRFAGGFGSMFVFGRGHAECAFLNAQVDFVFEGE